MTIFPSHVVAIGLALLVTTIGGAVVDKIPSYPLRDGNTMPQIGSGVYRAEPGEEAYQAVRWALELGYRLLDTAAMYENEADVGRAIRDSGIPRNEIFITTKLDTDSHGFQTALQEAQNCLDRLDMDYIDLLLIHSPFGGKIVETWDALIKLQKEGKVKSIGVSNFGVKHMKALVGYNRPIPSVNQIEMHPLIYKEREELVRYCREHNVIITAYGSLFSGYKERFEERLLQNLAEKYSKTVPQILLRWALDQGFAVIPKSASSKERLEENLHILDFKLSPEEVDAISEMEGDPLGEYWDPVKDADVDIGEVRDAEEL